MGNVSRPLIGLLVATVAFFALYTVALRPTSSSNGSGGTSASPAYQTAVKKAQAAVKQSQVAAAAADGHRPSPGAPTNRGSGQATTARTTAAQPAATTAKTPVTTSPAPTLKPTAPSAAAPPAKTATKRNLDAVTKALDAKRTIALLFFNPGAADDKAIKRELGAVPAHHRKVLKLAVPLSEITRYPLTNTLQVTQSPTLLIIDAKHDATMIVGFADRFEIAERVADALAVKAVK